MKTVDRPAMHSNRASDLAPSRTADSRRQLTILHMITQLGSGGAERMLTRIALGARETGAPRQIVISLLDEGVHGAALTRGGVELHCLRMDRGRPSLRSISKTVAIMRQARPDIVMTWLYHADLLGTIAARVAGIDRIVWNIRNSELEFERYAVSTRWTVSLLALLSGRPQAIVTNSAAGQRAHRNLGYRPRRWVQIPNGFDLEAWRPDAGHRREVRSEFGYGPDDVVVACVARVDPQKDHATLLDAASQALLKRPNLTFLLIGKGTEQLVIPDGLADRLIQLGERQDVPRLLRGCDGLVLSSAFGEGFPNAVGEAMASGLIPIVTDVGDSAVLVDEHGLVVPARDPAALATALIELAALAPSTRTSRGEAARQYVGQAYSIERISGEYSRLWQQLTENDTPPTDVDFLKQGN